MTKEWMGARLKLAREERGMTQAQLARAATTSRGTLSHIETGRFWPTLLVAIKVCLALRVRTRVMRINHFAQRPPRHPRFEWWLAERRPNGNRLPRRLKKRVKKLLRQCGLLRIQPYRQIWWLPSFTRR